MTTPHQSFAIDDVTRIGEARRAATRLAGDCGFDEVARGRVALVVTELGTNLYRHATGGRLLIGAFPDGHRTSLDVIALDDGPGMDVERCLADGYSTGGTTGTGLGAVRRLCDEFSVHSQRGRGTVVFGRLGAGGPGEAQAARAAYDLGVVCLAAPGETVCGDGWAFQAEGRVGRLLVADGLGHGPQAAEAAAAAVAVFESGRGQGPAQKIELVHAALRDTRGAAVAITVLEPDEPAIVFCGAGNVAGRLLSGVEDRTLLSQHGTAGLQIRRLQEIRYPWPEHAILVLHSDGIASRWTLADAGGLLHCHPAVIAGWLVREHLRGRDDATVVVVRLREA